MSVDSVVTIGATVLTVLGGILHTNSRFAELNTKVDLMYESFKQGILQPFAVRNKRDE